MNKGKMDKLLYLQKDFYLKEKDAVRDSKYFSKEETKEILEYLVSKVEGKNYTVEKYHMKKIGDSVAICVGNYGLFDSFF